MNIDAAKQLSVYLYREEDVELVIKKFPECKEKEVEIDFSQCMVDYPATSRVIDATLQRLEKLKSPCILTAAFNIDYEEQHLLKAFVFGSRLLGLSDGRLSNEQIRDLAVQGFKKHRVTFKIRIVDPDTRQELKVYTYG